MALEEDEQQQQQQTKRIKASHSSQPSEYPQSPPPLPPEMIFDILTRLPVKSLLRFRSVCKLWCSIVSDPRFIKSHLTNFSTTNINRSYAHHRLIYRNVPRIILKSCPLYDVLNDGGSVDDALELDYPLKHALKYVFIGGSCNGLVLIVNKDKDNDDVLVIWNPSTRTSIRLPNYGIKEGRGWNEVYGFGYDESTDDYKVVGISCARRDGVWYDIETTVNICSLKTGIWKKIDDFCYGYPYELSVMYSNGALHWVTTRSSTSFDSWMIVSLDLAKETCGEILQPVYDEGHTELTLGAVRELLCVLCDYDRSHADVWVMTVKDSWTKLVSIPYMNDPCWDGHYYSMPLWISNDGKVLLHMGLNLVVYDSKSRSVSKIQNFNDCLGAYIFIESLVSPISIRAGAGDNNNNDGLKSR